MTRRRWLLGGCLGLLAAFPALATPASLGAAEHRFKLVIITHKASPLSEVSLRELKRLYIGEHVSGADGKKLMPLNQPSASPDRVGFDQVVLKMSPDEIGRFWIDRKIRGQPGPPRSVAADLLRRAVASIPGTLGYIRESDIDAQVKVLAIDGKRPDDAGYPLQY